MDDQLLRYMLLAALWLAWCAVHSLLIAPTVVRRLQEGFPQGRRYYRLMFNIISILTFIPIVGYTLTFQADYLFRWEGLLRIPQAFAILTGVSLVIAGALKYDFKELAGFSQIMRKDACSTIGVDCELNTTGVLQLIRHPWYTAVIILLWARDLDPAAIIINSVLTIYVVIGTFLEERKLTAEFGRAYRDYQEEVSMFLPFKWLASKFGLR